MDVQAVTDVRTGFSVDFIKSTADPVRYAVAPPNTHNNSAFIKKIDYSMNFEIGDDTSLAAEQVPTKTGLVLFFPLLGANSIFHMGIVPGGAQNANNGETQEGLRGLSQKLSYFRFDRQLALPYNATVGEQQIKIAPDLSLDFSITRMFASVMTLSSPTVPVAGVAFNGQLAIGCVHDTRDIAQVFSGSETSVYSPTDLSQQSVTSKDGIRDVKSEDGVTGIQGSEIDTEYSPPNQSRIDFAHGEWLGVPLTGQGVVQTPDQVAAFGATPGAPIIMASVWVSPWQTTCETFLAVNGLSPLQRVITEAIGETDVLDIELAGILFKNNITAPQSATRVFVGYVQAIHVFCTCSVDGSVQYNTFAETHTTAQYSSQVQYYTQSVNNSGADLVAYGSGSIVCALPQVGFYPKKFQNGMTTTGKYCGTSINIGIINMTPGNTQDPAGSGYFFDFDGLTNVYAQKCYNTTGGVCSMFIKPHSLYVRGVIGPCKVFRWDGQSQNSVMRLEGISRVQCIPQGSIAPYVQGAAMNAPNAVDMNALCIVSELYNGNTSFQRSWRSQDYYRWIREFIPNLDSTNLFREAKDSTKALSALEAGGIFDAIGQGLAGLGMGVGRGITHLLGAGQFGVQQQPLEASGQFGLNYAGGNYGGLRRNRMD